MQTFVQRLLERNAMLNIQERMAETNGNMECLSSLLALRKFPSQQHNPFNRIPLFDGNAPTDTDEVARLLVEAMGASFAEKHVAQITQTSYEQGKFAEAMELEKVEEILGQIVAMQNEQAKNKTVQLRTSAEDELAPEAAEELPGIEEDAEKGKGESFSLNIKLNEKQQAAYEFALSGKSFCVIGPAGSGKTTAERSIMAALHQSGRLSTTTFAAGGGSRVTAPSVAVCAFTRRATGNSRLAIHKDPELRKVFEHNIMTVHALLEYTPESYYDELEGRTKFRFAPRRNANNPLTITHLVIEEASQIGMYDLYQKLYEALPAGITIIFVGDINQIPPVFGPSVLNYALSQLPIVELTEVYRNQGMVLENAHNILNGRKLVETPECQIIRGNKPVQHGQEMMGNRIIPNLFKSLYEQRDSDGERIYDPEYDMILSPWNKQAMGTNNLNNWIAQHQGDSRGAIVHEILAGFNKLYLAVGDPVMVNKQDATIIAIEPNPKYMGRAPQLPGNDLSRFGHRIYDRVNTIDIDEMADAGAIDYSNFSLESIVKEEAERKQQCSHIIVVKYDYGYEETLSNAGDFGEQVFSLGYCLTCHKAQGSEWRRVFIVLHKDHGISLYREWLYTAYTRARIGVYIIAKDFVIDKAIATQRIKGHTLKDKLAFFNAGMDKLMDMSVLPPAA